MTQERSPYRTTSTKKHGEGEPNGSGGSSGLSSDQPTSVCDSPTKSTPSPTRRRKASMLPPISSSQLPSTQRSLALLSAQGKGDFEAAQPSTYLTQSLEHHLVGSPRTEESKLKEETEEGGKGEGGGEGALVQGEGKRVEIEVLRRGLREAERDENGQEKEKEDEKEDEDEEEDEDGSSSTDSPSKTRRTLPGKKQIPQRDGYAYRTRSTAGTERYFLYRDRVESVFNFTEFDYRTFPLRVKFAEDRVFIRHFLQTQMFHAFIQQRMTRLYVNAGADCFDLRVRKRRKRLLLSKYHLSRTRFAGLMFKQSGTLLPVWRQKYV